jgi:hypothetical protein
MPLVLDPDMVEPLYDQAVPSAEATVMEPMSDTPEAIEIEAAERTAMAIAILAYGVEFAKDAPPETLAEIEADYAKKPIHHDYLIARFDVTELSELERCQLATEITVQAEVSEHHPSVPSPELTWVDDMPRPIRKMVDIVREAYFHDPTVSDTEYGRLMEEADQADQARELEAEVPPASDEEIDNSFDAYR